MRKVYIHKEFVQGILFCGVGVALFINDLEFSVKAVIPWILFIITLIGLIWFLYLLWYYRHKEELKTVTNEDLEVEFGSNIISFPNGYYYKYSTLNEDINIDVKTISAINLTTSPPSLIINDDEVIFIPNRLLTSLKEFGERNNLPFDERYDIWSAINQPFLDTEFSKGYKIQNIYSLEKNGVSKEEVISIRKKIRLTMFLNNSLFWEWVDLSQFDYLNWTYLTHKKYWWTMEVALRNFKK